MTRLWGLRPVSSAPTARRRAVRLLASAAALAVLLPSACGGQPVGPAPAEAPQAPVSTATSGQSVELGGMPAATPRKGTAADGSGLGLGSYLAGRHAQDVSDTSAAADNYLEALKADPGNVALARRAYFFLLAEGRYDRALELAARVLDLDADASVAPLVLAVGAAARDDFAAAWPYVADLEPQGLNSFLVPLLQGWILAGQGRTEDALAALAPMADSPQLDQLHQFHAGLVLDLAGRPDDAMPLYDAAVAPDNPLTLRTVEVVAAFLRRQGRQADALALIGRYREEHPDSVLIEAVFDRFQDRPADWRPIATARQGLAEALYGAASSVLQSGAADTALMFARLSLLLDPDFPYGRMLVGDILTTQQRWEAAATVYDSLPADSPVHFPVRLQLAETLERLERADEAADILRDLATAYPQAAAPLIQLGDLRRRQERWDAAIEAYRGAFGRLPGERDTHWALHYSLGVALERAGRWPEAEKAFLKALDLNPDHPLVLNYLGYSWIDQGINLEQGKALIERAVRQRPNDGFIVDSLGWAHYLLGDFAAAVVELERAVELAPADPTINEHLGDALWQVGRRTEARFQWQRALSLEPEPDVVESIEKKLRDGLPPPKPRREGAARQAGNGP
ncbi:tetratricopeptide repeat protein [Novispirillum sp. DQ9]|uniref:tetratricopeptide repeat protein n=1 Tax=Novispirillum sp. DQ9 TaxID=3398612 RepID=UPI003C7A991F